MGCNILPIGKTALEKVVLQHRVVLEVSENDECMIGYVCFHHVSQCVFACKIMDDT